MMFSYSPLEFRKQRQSFLAVFVVLTAEILSVAAAMFFQGGGSLTAALGDAADSALLFVPICICFLAARPALLLSTSVNQEEEPLPISMSMRIAVTLLIGAVQVVALYTFVLALRLLWSHRLMAVLGFQTPSWYFLMLYLYLLVFFFAYAFRQSIVASALGLIVWGIQIVLAYYLGSDLSFVGPPLLVSALITGFLLFWLARSTARGLRFGLWRGALATILVLATFASMPAMQLREISQWCNDLSPVGAFVGIINARLLESRKESGYVMATLNGNVIRILQDGSQETLYESDISLPKFFLLWLKFGDEEGSLSYFYPFRALYEEPDGLWFELDDPDFQNQNEVWHESGNNRQLITAFTSNTISPVYFIQVSGRTYLMGYPVNSGQEAQTFYAMIEANKAPDWKLKPDTFQQIEGGTIGEDKHSLTLGSQSWVLPGRAGRLSVGSVVPGAVIIDDNQTIVVAIVKDDGYGALAVCRKNGDVLTVDLPFIKNRVSRDFIPLQMSLMPGGGVLFSYDGNLRLVIGNGGTPFPPFETQKIVDQLHLPGLTVQQFPYEFLHLDHSVLYVLYKRVLFEIDLLTGKAKVSENEVYYPQARPEGIYFLRNGRVFLRKPDKTIDLGTAVRK